MALTKRTYVDGETIITAQNLNDIQDEIIAHESNKVPITRTVNGKALSSNITLSASDVSAVPTGRKVNNKALSSDVTINASDIPNDSTVSGTKVDDALEALLSAIGDVNKFTSTEAINFDTETRSFVYFDFTNSTGTKPDVSSNGYLFTFQRSSNYAIQFAVDSRDTDGRVYMRRKKSGTWDSWASVSHGDLMAKEITPTINDPLPTGVTAVGCLGAIQSGNVVTVSFGITRDTNNITSWANIATGLPSPKNVFLSGSAAIPMGECSVGDSYGRPLQLYVNSSGNLRIKYGNVSSGTQQFIGSFTYITDKI